MGHGRLGEVTAQRPAGPLAAVGGQRGDDPQARGVAQRVQDRLELELVAGGVVEGAQMPHDDHCTTGVELLVRCSSYFRI